jgi:hypothetical protein
MLFKQLVYVILRWFYLINIIFKFKCFISFCFRGMFLQSGILCLLTLPLDSALPTWLACVFRSFSWCLYGGF